MHFLIGHTYETARGTNTFFLFGDTVTILRTQYAEVPGTMVATKMEMLYVRGQNGTEGLILPSRLQMEIR